MIKKIISLLTAFIMIFSLIAGVCTLDAMAATTKKSDASKNLVLRLEGGDWGFPNPYAHYPRGPGGYKMQMLFDSLLEKDEKGDIPWLASKYVLSNGGRDYTFTLRNNVKWHDGKPFTAEDVKFSFDYYKNHPPVWNELSINGKYIITGVDVLNKNEVKIKTIANNVTFLSKLGSMRIIPKHIWQNVSDPIKFTTKESAIGCGPFKFVSYDRSKGAYRFEANKNYWGPKPRVSAVEWIPVSNSLLAFEKGDIDFTSVPVDALSRYKDNKNVKIIKNKPFWGYRLILNMKKNEELKSLDIRKALAYAINREELLNKVGRGSGVVGSMGFLPKGHVNYNPNIEQYAFDEAKAKTLMNGKQMKFELLVSSSPEEVKMAELIKLHLKNIGIEINVKSVDGKSRDSLIAKESFDLAITGHGGWGVDPDILREIYSQDVNNDKGPLSKSLPGYDNAVINKLANAQMIESNVAKRKDMVNMLQAEIAKDVPLIPLYNPIDNFIYKPSKYDGWMCKYDHHYHEHCKLSYLSR